MTLADDTDAELLQDRLELLRLRTLLVGGLGILALVVGVVTLVGFGSHVVKLVGQALVSNTGGFHVPSNLFQTPPDEAWARTPVLLQLAFAAIGIAGIAQMTRQVLSRVQVRLWFAVLLGLAALLVLALKAGNMSSFSLSATYDARARFDNIGGLKIRALADAMPSRCSSALRR